MKADAVRVLRDSEIIRYPLWTVEAAEKARLPLPLACALLEQESGGGRNVFGHDRDRHGDYIWPAHDGQVLVTERLYAEYKRRRGPKGLGGMQGVGPMQLTWYTLQDEADALGGCWQPLPNMIVGFTKAAALVRRYGIRAGIKAYNGTGDAADLYAHHVVDVLLPKWTSLLGAKPVTHASATKQPKPKTAVLNPRDWWKAYVYGDTDCERALLTALANVAKDVGGGARVFVRCGTRTRLEQAALYAVYLRDGHPLTARPGTSNHEAHPPAKVGKAADCQLVRENGHANKHMVNIGDDERARLSMRKRGLCLPVPGEPWHVERGTTWKA